MANSFLRQSPLAHLHLAARSNNASNALPVAGVLISERPYLKKLTLRGNANEPKFMGAIKKVFKLPLPIKPCTSFSNKAGSSHNLWMGPDEWLIVGPSNETGHLFSNLKNALKNLHYGLVDNTESRTLIQLSGSQARSVLEKGCSIDLHPRSFKQGSVVNTLLGHAHVTLHLTALTGAAEHPIFNLYIHRSFAEYLWSWLEDASCEYGLENNSE
jgi:sarcosine oxidase subunit gamma